FRSACESAAGAPLDEVFSYAATTRPVDYAKYFALAGLELTSKTEPAAGSSLGVEMQTVEGKLTVGYSEAAGLKTGDQIVEVEGTKATPKVLADILAARKPGDSLKLKLDRGEVQVTPGENVKRSYSIRPMASPTGLQGEIAGEWLRGRAAHP